MKSLKIAAALAALMLLSEPAAAQSYPDSHQFIEAVKKRDGDKATQMLKANPNLVDVRNGKGDTGLLIAIRERDPRWTGFLIQQGADPNLPGANGDTPLIAAARSDLIEAVGWLLQAGVKVDATNKSGETALIIAVQQRNRRLAGALLEAGADPDRTDSVAGLSARDYAKRDTRARDIQQLLNATKAKPATSSN